MKETATFLSWAVSCSQGRVLSCLSLEHNGPDASTCPQAAIFSSAPGGRLFLPGARMGVIYPYFLKKKKSFNIYITC